MRKSVILRRLEYGVSRSPHFFCLTGVQGRFLAALEMTIREGFCTSPSFLWKEVPRRGGGWLSQRNEREWGGPSLVSSSRAQARDLSCRRENGTYEEVRHSKSYEVRCFPRPSLLLSDRCARKISRFARNDDTGKSVIWEETSPSFLWKEVPRRGGGWLSQRDKTRCETARPSFRHPERSRGIFLAGWKTVHMRKSVIPSRMEYGVSRSPHFFSLTGVQGRFLASLEMTIRGRLLRFSLLPLEGGAPKGRRLARAAR